MSGTAAFVILQHDHDTDVDLVSFNVSTNSFMC